MQKRLQNIRDEDDIPPSVTAKNNTPPEKKTKLSTKKEDKIKYKKRRRIEVVPVVIGSPQTIPQHSVHPVGSVANHLRYWTAKAPKKMRRYTTTTPIRLEQREKMESSSSGLDLTNSTRNFIYFLTFVSKLTWRRRR